MVLAVSPTTSQPEVSLPAGPTIDAIPAELRAGKRFVAWRFEDRRGETKPAKMPYSPEAPKGASSTDRSHWTTFDQARRYARVAGLDGVMRAFDHADGYVGADLDNCLDPSIQEPGIDDLDEWAAEYVRRLDTYTEVSPSGTGVKLWAKGTMPAFGHKRGDVEMYGSVAGSVGPCGRFFTQTGRHLKDTPQTVTYRPDAILAIHREVFGEAPDPAAINIERDGPVPALELGDEDVLRLASESPHNGERFRRLWAGDSSDYAADKNDGASEADGALCEILAYYGGPDIDRIERLFSRSGLCDEKWEKRADYRERTIRLALKGKTRFYGNGLQSPKTAGSDGATGCACESYPAIVEIGQLRRLALDRDDLVEYQQAIIRTQRTKLDEKTAFLSRISDVLAKPNEELSPGEKVVALGLLTEIHFRADRRGYTLPDGTEGSYRTESGRIRMTREAIARRTGYSPSQASKIGRQIAARPGAPFSWSTTREWKAIGDGTGPKDWVTTIEIDPRTERTADSLQAVAALPALPDKPKHGGSKAAAEATSERWRRCEAHQDADVILRAFCKTCGEVLGERRARAQECGALEVQDGLPGGGPQPVAVLVPIVVQDALPDELTLRRGREAVGILSRPPDPSKQPGYQHPPPTRCRLCASLELYQLEDGRWRCEGCGEVAS